MNTRRSSRFPGRWWLPSLVAAGALLFSACANTYEMKVDSLTSPKLGHVASYRIVNRNPTVDTDSLRYKEVEKAVKAALSGKGMYEAPEPDKADVTVNLDYGIKPPRVVQETRSEPIYATTPGQFHTQTVQIGMDRQGNPIYTTVTTQDPPTTDYIGNDDYVVPVVIYEKYLRLSARENKPAAEGKQPQEVWAVDVSTEGPSNNLRKYVPIMAAATIGYIGKDTSGEKSVRLKDDKEGDLAFVKKGM
jgi:hypothetical protein